MVDKDPLDDLPPVARDKAYRIMQHLPKGWRLSTMEALAQPTGTTFLLSFTDTRGIRVAVNTIYCGPEELA